MTKKEKQKNNGGHGKSLAVTFIGAALGLLFYCGSFYAKAYMENREAAQSYDALRKVCLTGELADGRSNEPGSPLARDRESAHGRDGRKFDMEVVDAGCGLSGDGADSNRAEAGERDGSRNGTSTDKSAANGTDTDKSDRNRADTDKSAADASRHPRTRKPAVSESFGISWEALYKVNRDIVAWVSVPGADISYPVVQGEDDEFYLHHSIGKEEDPFGTIFLGCGNTWDFSDSHSFLYGHNMEGNMMFANLNRYEDREFLVQCPEFVIYTPEEMYRYRIFSVEQAGEQSPCFQYGYQLGSREYKTQLNMLAGNSMYPTGITADSNEPMVTLVTCNSRLDEHIRMTIHGIRSEVVGADAV